jgi:hypothetical protein
VGSVNGYLVAFCPPPCGGQEYNEREQAEPALPVDDLLALVTDIVPFHMQHNGEAEGVDLLMETQQLGMLLESEYVDASNFARVCLYLIRSADYCGDADESKELLETAYEVSLQSRWAPRCATCWRRTACVSVILFCCFVPAAVVLPLRVTMIPVLTSVLSLRPHSRPSPHTHPTPRPGFPLCSCS